MNDLKNRHHRSYLLRLWRTEGLRDFEWRASLEIPETGQRIGFATLEQLFVYLMDLTEGQATTGPGTEKTETGKRNEDMLDKYELLAAEAHSLEIGADVHRPAVNTGDFREDH